MATKITIRATVHAPVEKVWKLWTGPEHIMQWNNASDDWHTPHATNDLRVGGKFLSHMAAKDSSMSFDFEGTYSKVEPHKAIEYTISDGRKVKTTFATEHKGTSVETVFEAESTHSIDMQQAGWQAILDNFKKYAESKTMLEKLHFEIRINASTEKVFSTMLNEKSYRAWTAVFNPTSHFRGSWAKGSKILFIGTDEKGNEGGMVSRIRENIPNAYVSIEHIGVLQGGKEITSGKDVDGWAGSFENYTYTKADTNQTQLKVDLDSNPEFKSYFLETYPKALKILKELCER
ncbi:MAG: SRPBCC family protein [Cyclobacteriaceae bacterium]|nr:SRPBCC family protein [Cyclobacteriaceae bacterium]